jgi:riboflavin transporter FmnP
MIRREPISYKRIWLWSLLVACGLLTAYIFFISVVSVWVGLDHMHQSGFWVPILVGLLVLASATAIFLRIARGIRRLMRDQDLIRL